MFSLLLILFINHTKANKMSKFNYASKGNIAPSLTKEYEIVEIKINGVSPVLIVTPSTEANTSYTNAMLKVQTGKRQSKHVTAARLKELDVMDRKLYPLYVIKGWKYVPDDKGVDVQFNLEDCNDFINQLPDHVFARLRDYCGKVETWTDDVDIELAVKK